MGDSRDAKSVPAMLQARSLQLPFVGDVPLNLNLSRREMLKLTGYGSLAAFLAACGTSSATGNPGFTAKGGSLTVGSNGSDPGNKAGVQAIVDAFTAANGGTKVKINTVDHGTFQNQISQYLGATPED